MLESKDRDEISMVLLQKDEKLEFSIFVIMNLPLSPNTHSAR